MTHHHVNDVEGAHAASRQTQPELGLVCQTLSEQVRFRTITLSRYRALSESDRPARLRELYRDNLARLLGALGFCWLNDIRLYRMPSGLFPMSDEVVGEATLRAMADDLAMVGRLAGGQPDPDDNRAGCGVWSIRVVMHPDQFAVLSSHRPEVVRQSAAILSKHGLWMDLMGLPRSPWSAIILHGGVAGRGAELAKAIGELEPGVRSRLVLENDEWSYSASEILEICRATNVPMVFDAHHHLIKEKLESYDDPSIAAMTEAAAETWSRPEWAIVHISNGRDGLHDRRHSDVILTMPRAFRRSPWIEVETKSKELAIAHLREHWLRRRRSRTRRREQ